VPFVIFLLVAALAVVLPRLFLPDQVLLDTIQKNLPAQTEVSPEDMEGLLKMMRAPAMLVLNGLGGAFVAGLGTILATLFLWGLFAILGDKPTFLKSLTVVSYTSLIKGLGTVLVIILMLILQRQEVYTSLAVLPFLEPKTYFYNLAAQIDFFTVWRLIVMGFGFAIVLNASKVKSYLSVFVPWILLSVVLAAVMLSLSRFGLGR